MRAKISNVDSENYYSVYSGDSGFIINVSFPKVIMFSKCNHLEQYGH